MKSWCLREWHHVEDGLILKPQGSYNVGVHQHFLNASLFLSKHTWGVIGFTSM